MLRIPDKGSYLSRQTVCSQEIFYVAATSQETITAQQSEVCWAAFYVFLCERILTGIENTTRLIVPDLIDAKKAQSRIQRLSDVSKAQTAMMGESILY